MSKDGYRFPGALKFVHATIEEQVASIERETTEITAATHLRTPDREFRIAEEALDTIHAAETLLRILATRHNVDVKSVEEYVINKNLRRHYYRPEVRA